MHTLIVTEFLIVIVNFLRKKPLRFMDNLADNSETNYSPKNKYKEKRMINM